MKRKFTYGFLLVAMSVATLGSFVSCKDYEEDLRLEYEITAYQLNDLISGLRTDLNTLAGQQAALALLQQNCSTQCALDRAEQALLIQWLGYDIYNDPSLASMLAAMQALIDANTAGVGNNATAIANNATAIANLQTLLATCQQTCQDNFAALGQTDANLAALIAALQAQVGNLNLTDDQGNPIDLAAFLASLQELLGDLSQMGEGQSIVSILSDLQAQIGELGQGDVSISELLTALQNQVTNNTTSIETIMSLIGNLTGSESVIDLITALQDRATAIENDMDTAEQTIATLNELVNQLNDWKNNNNFVTQEVFDATVTEINDTINSITSQITQITSDLASVTSTANEALQLAQNNQTIINNHTDSINSHSQLIATIQNNINTINEKLETFATKSELLLVEQKAEAAQAKADANEILINNLRSEYEVTKAKLDSINTTVTQQGEKIDSAITRITDLETKAEQLAQDIATARQEAADNLQAAKDAIKVVTDALENRISANEAAISSLTDSVDAQGRQIAENGAKISELDERVFANEQNIATLQNAVNTINETLTSLDSRVGTVEEQMATALQTIETLTSNVANLTERMEVVESAVAKIPEIEEHLSQLDDKVAKNTEDIENLKSDVTALAGKLQDLINRLNKMITGIIVQGVVNPVYGTFNTPFGISSNVLCAYYGKATSDGIEFPTSDVSLYYKGNSSIEVLTDEDVDIFYNSGQSGFTAAQNETLFDDVAGNAGKLYMTVNPASVDISGTKFSLVDSQDKESPIQLGTLHKSDDLMVFGLGTRAGNGNGFYVTDATINKNFYQAAPKVNLTKANLQNAYENLKVAAHAAKGGTSNIRTVAESVMKAAANVSGVVASYIPAYGIKAPWQYTDENGSLVEDAVYSKYEIAALAVDPLSFASVNALDSKIHGVPGIGTIENMIHRFANTVKGQLPKKLADEFGVEKFDTARIQTINLEDISFDDFVISISVDDDFPIDIEEVVMNNVDVLIPWDAIEELYFSYDTQVYDETTGEIKDSTIVQHIQHPATEGIPATITEVRFDPTEQNIHIKFTYTDEALTKALQNKFNEMKASLEGINPMLEYLKGYLTSINQLIDRVNDYDLGQYVDKVENKLLEVVQKFADVLEPYMKPSDWLQPFLVAYDGTKVYPLTGSATVNNGKLTFIATSRTAELLAPSFKKWVAVTDVIKGDKSAKKGDAALKAVRDKANNSNAELNTILRGVTRAINADLQSGYTYEISYQALDYSGKVSAKKYLVTVK